MEEHFCKFWKNARKPLREKCPNAEFSLDRIFLHSDWVRRFPPYLNTFHAESVTSFKSSMNKKLLELENKIIHL